MSRSDEDVLRFIAASFPSVWALELLLALKSERRSWTEGGSGRILRASELVVAKALDALVAAGLASFEGDGADYPPVNRDAEACVELAEQLYRARPNGTAGDRRGEHQQRDGLCRRVQLRKGRDD